MDRLQSESSNSKSKIPNSKFPPERRLKKPADFQRVYDRRCSAADGLLVIYCCQNDRPFPRLGLSVSRKVGGAVVRNRWKRLLREAFRLSQYELPAGMDLIVIPRQGSEPELTALQQSLVRLAGRLRGKLAKVAP